MIQGDQRFEVYRPHPPPATVSTGVRSTTAPCTLQGTGESTYDPPPGVSAGGLEGGGGELVEGGERSASSSSGWIKYYDAEYAVDYYYNVRYTCSQYNDAHNLCPSSYPVLFQLAHATVLSKFGVVGVLQSWVSLVTVSSLKPSRASRGSFCRLIQLAH